MKLYFNPPSPYARKVLVAAHEVGLIDEIELYEVDPWSDPPALLDATPLGKVPALITNSGSLVTESTTICMVLDAASRSQSIARAGTMDVFARASLAQGLTDAAFGIVIEQRRPENRQLTSWTDRMVRAIKRTLPHLEATTRFDLGDVSLACALAYLDFRLGSIGWRDARPDLADWLDRVAERPSMIATRPA